jgi:Flp pilus assembly protein TadD
MLVLLTAWLWSPTLKFGFVYDDHLQIESNPQMQSWIGLGQALREPLWMQLGPEKASPYHRPLFLLALFVQRMLFGTYPLLWHLVSICLHIFVVLALFLFLCMELRRTLPAFSGACIFACSPLATETISWVSASSESLYTLFVLLALCALSFSRRTATPQGVLLLRITSAGALKLAVFAKETAIVGVLVALLYEVLILDRKLRSSTAPHYLPLAIPLAAFLWIHSFLHHADTRSIAEVLSLTPYISLLAFRKLVWPVPVSEFYDLWVDQAHPITSAAMHIISLAGIAGVMLWIRARSKFAAWALPVVILPLAAVIAGAFFFRDYDLFHDRYLYLSLAGIAMLIAALVAKSVSRTELRLLAIGITAIVVCAEAWQSRIASAQFANDASLFSHAIEVAPHNIVAMQLLAETALVSKDCHTAIEAYQRAQQLRPDLWKTSFYLGIGDLRCEMAESAEGAFAQAAAVNGATAEQRALAWYELGRLQFDKGDLTDSLTSLSKAASLDPSSHKIKSVLAQILSSHQHL